MYKHSPSRNQRSKGFKVKHVLQICLLVAVCFWLIYQVKRSYDKRKEFDEHDSKISLEEKDEIVKLGRKDLNNPRVEDPITKEVDEEEEEDEENKPEEEVNKPEEKDDGELDEENDREEDILDDEKEREISDDQEDTEDNNNKQIENQDREGSARNTHEAREENYKADDASSAVTGISDKSNQESVAKVENGENVNNSTSLPAINKENTTSNSNVTKGFEDQSAISNNSTLEVPNIAIEDPNFPNSDLHVENNHQDSNSTDSHHKESLELELPGEDNEANEETGEEINEDLDGSDPENLDEVPHDPIDSSDSSIFLEEKDVRMDLETLPEIQIEGSNSEDAVE